MQLNLKEHFYKVASEIYVIASICSFFLFFLNYRIEGEFLHYFQFIALFNRECLKQHVKIFVSQILP